MRFLLIIILLISLNACTGVEKSTEKVLSNANDALKPNDEQVWWMSPEEKNQVDDGEQAVPSSLRK